MPSKRQLAHLKKARAASVQALKKRKLEASSLANSAQLLIDDKLNKSDAVDTEAEFRAMSRNEGLNRGDHPSQEGEYHNVEEPDFQGVQSISEGATELECRPKEMKWSKEGENKLRGVYGKGSRSTRKRQKKSARELELGASNTYKLGALWQSHTAMKHTVSKNSLLTEEELGNTLGEAKEVRTSSKVQTTQQLSMIGADPGVIPYEGCGTGNPDGNDLQRRYDDIASLQ